jgi:hypothetical protein
MDGYTSKTFFPIARPTLSALLQDNIQANKDGERKPGQISEAMKQKLLGESVGLGGLPNKPSRGPSIASYFFVPNHSFAATSSFLQLFSSNPQHTVTKYTTRLTTIQVTRACVGVLCFHPPAGGPCWGPSSNA